MGRSKPAWQVMLPGGKSADAYSLDELRAAKQAHAFLTEDIAGPPEMARCIRAFRYLLFFGIACVAEDKYPPLTRAWKDLERRFMHDPAFDDGIFIQSWLLMDFPFGPAGQTALDYFDEFVHGTDAAAEMRPFIESARKSRLGLHQDVMRTKTVAKFRELLSGRTTEVVPTIEEYGKGEILLVRAITCGEHVYFFGNPKGFPKEKKEVIEDMVLDKLFSISHVGDSIAQYETFMKLAGPYWMSCVCSDEDAPVLAPDHYRTYLERRA